MRFTLRRGIICLLFFFCFISYVFAASYTLNPNEFISSTKYGSVSYCDEVTFSSVSSNFVTLYTKNNFIDPKIWVSTSSCDKTTAFASDDDGANNGTNSYLRFIPSSGVKYYIISGHYAATSTGSFDLYIIHGNVAYNQLPPPNAVINITQTNINSIQFTGSSSATSYSIQVSTTGQAALATASSVSITNTSYIIPGITSNGNTDTWIRITSVNSSGSSSPVDLLLDLTPPTGLTSIFQSNTNVFSFIGSNADQYLIQTSLDNKTTYSAETLVSSATYTWTGLTLDGTTTKWIKVTPIDSFGNRASSMEFNAVLLLTTSGSNATQSLRPLLGTISVSNNPVGTSDVITIANLQSGDLITVYDANKNKLGTATATLVNAQYTATYRMAQLGSSTGNVYITVTNLGLTESPMTLKSFFAEQATPSVLSSKITITNNTGPVDSVAVQGLLTNDVMRVYLKSSPQVITTANFEQSYDAFVGSSSSFVTTPVKYGQYALSVTTPTSGVSHTFTNLLTTEDYFVIFDVYMTPNTTLSAKFGSVIESTITSPVTPGYFPVVVKIPNSSIANGQATMSILANTTATTSLFLDGLRLIDLPMNSLQKNTDPLIGNSSNDRLLNVFPFSGYLGKSVANASGIATFSGSFGEKTGTLLITNTSGTAPESIQSSKSFNAELSSATLSSTQVTVTNANGTSDTVAVSKVSTGATVKLYQVKCPSFAITCNTTAQTFVLAATNPSVTTGKTAFTIDASTFVDRKAYVSIQEQNKNESKVKWVSIPAEKPSDRLMGNYITISNNKNKIDTITCTRLTAGDVINVYRGKYDVTPFATGTVTINSSVLTLTTELGDVPSTVYVARKRGSQTESIRIVKTYMASK